MKWFVLISLLFAVSASAQTTYRWVDPTTGHTIISDLPPEGGIKYTKKGRSAGHSTEKQIPYAVQQAAAKFPVILYLAPNCQTACDRANELLSQRGVPFQKVEFKSQEEAADLRAELGEKFLIPSIRVGRQLSSGFNAAQWNELLDLAGYPKNASRQ